MSIEWNSTEREGFISEMSDNQQGSPQINQDRCLVSDVEVIPFRPRDGHLGFASCVINGQFYLSDIAIFSRPKGGIRLGYPIKTLANGVVLSVFKPLSRDVESAIEAAVTREYESLMKNNGSAKESNDLPKRA